MVVRLLAKMKNFLKAIILFLMDWKMRWRRRIQIVHLARRLQMDLKTYLICGLALFPLLWHLVQLPLFWRNIHQYLPSSENRLNPILSVLGIPEAADAAQLMVVGFTDMFLPVILAEGLITSELTLFVVATISVVQLIFMAEVGGLLLGSKIPVNFLDLVIIFLLRTIIALPIVAGVAHLLF